MASHTQIFIRDLRLTMDIGIYPHEKTAPQPVVVNITADVATAADWEADTYDQVVCYATIADTVRGIAAKGHIKLAETFAERIAAACLATKGVLAVTVRVEKTGIMPDAAGVGVEIRREKA